MKQLKNITSSVITDISDFLCKFQSFSNSSLYIWPPSSWFDSDNSILKQGKDHARKEMRSSLPLIYECQLRILRLRCIHQLPQSRGRIRMCNRISWLLQICHLFNVGGRSQWFVLIFVKERVGFWIWGSWNSFGFRNAPKSRVRVKNMRTILWCHYVPANGLVECFLAGAFALKLLFCAFRTQISSWTSNKVGEIIQSVFARVWHKWKWRRRTCRFIILFLHAFKWSKNACLRFFHRCFWVDIHFFQF